MKKQYKYIPLAGAKLVGRRHVRDIPLPGLRELKNAFISKSDHAITMRPDFDPISENLLALSLNSPDTDDYLNSVAGIYGSSDLIWISKLAPITWDGSTSAIACSSYSTGTATGSSGSAAVAFSGSSLIHNAWRGCYIRFDTGADNGYYYKISSVNGNNSVTLSSNLSVTHTGDTFAIYRTHQPDFADYKLNLQPFTSGMIYSSPTITMPVDANKICGPFYAAMVESSTEQVWSTLTDDTDMDLAGETNDTMYQLCATSGTSFMAFSGKDSGTDPVLSYSTTPATDWSLITPPSNFDMSGCIIFNSGFYYVTGRNTSTSRMAVAYSVDGASWTVKSHPSLDDTAFAIAGNGGSTMAVFVDGSEQTCCYYTTDNWDTWNAVDVDAVYSLQIKNAQYCGDTFFAFSGSRSYYSTDAVSWTYNGARLTSYEDVAYSPSGSFWLFTGGAVNPGNLAKITTLGGQPSYSSLTGEDFKHILWSGDKFLVTDQNDTGYSTIDGIGFEAEHTAATGIFASGAYSYAGNVAVYPIQSTPGVYPIYAISNQTQTVTTWSTPTFEPLSDDYRALTHSVLDGYVMLLGVTEYSTSTNAWEFHPRRIRWTAPLTYADFTSTGSGTADLDGGGTILDSRAVNGRIVTFESSQIGAISPRGYTNDPWEYDVIRDNIRAISNPVVVDDVCYFVDDSGLMRTTNGMTVDEPPFAFDITEFDDFNADTPIWLTYSPELDALVVFNPAATTKYLYLIELSGGSASRVEIKNVANAGGDVRPAKSVVCIEHASDRRLMVGFNPRSGDAPATKLLVGELSTGDTVTGIDEMTTTAADDTYHFTDIKTPEDWIVMEGAKTGIKHLILRTYCDGTAEATNPVVGVQVRSAEDSDWHDNGDGTGTITVSTTACAGAGTAWSNTVWSGSDVYVTPCLATQARVYIGTTLQVLDTHYTITGTKEITFASTPGDTVYMYWENEPFIRTAVDDLIQSTEGLHRIVTIPTAVSMTLDHYLSTGTDATAEHIPAARMPVGDGEVKIGISKLTEGARFRIVTMADASGDATVAKVTGYSIGHLPAGEKIVEP